MSKESLVKLFQYSTASTPWVISRDQDSYPAGPVPMQSYVDGNSVAAYGMGVVGPPSEGTPVSLERVNR